MSGLKIPALTPRRLRIVIVYTLIFVLAGYLGNIWMTRNQASGLAPEIIAQDLDGKPYTLSFKPRAKDSEPPPLISAQQSNLRQKTTLVYFFAEWCPICKLQHSAISSINRDYQVLGIALQSENADKLKKYTVEQDIQFEVINDDDGAISRSFGVNGVPATFIINPDGIIQYSTRGYATEAGLRSRIWLANKT